MHFGGVTSGSGRGETLGRTVPLRGDLREDSAAEGRPSIGRTVLLIMRTGAQADTGVGGTWSLCVPAIPMPLEGSYRHVPQTDRSLTMGWGWAVGVLRNGKLGTEAG